VSAPLVHARRAGWLRWNAYLSLTPPRIVQGGFTTIDWQYAGAARTRWGALRKARRAARQPQVVRDPAGRPTRVEVPGLGTVARIRAGHGPVTAADIITTAIHREGDPRANR
jgi:hypothetical protein